MSIYDPKVVRAEQIAETRRNIAINLATQLFIQAEELDEISGCAAWAEVLDDTTFAVCVDLPDGNPDYFGRTDNPVPTCYQVSVKLIEEN